MNALRHNYKHALGGILILVLGGLLMLSFSSATPAANLTLGVPLQEEEQEAPTEPESEPPTEETGEPVQGEGEGVPEQEQPVIRGLVEVVVARSPIPPGTVFRAELLSVELRPSDNVAVRAGVTFSDPELLIGQVSRTNIARGQEILAPMIALSPTDVASFGSDLAMFVDRGKVAVAFPINQYTGIGYTMRPGDLVDVLMSFNMLELDVDFQTPLPNLTQRVDEDALLAGQQFLFPAVSQGRLEFITEINSVAEITPRGVVVPQPVLNPDGTTGTLENTIVNQAPRRVTQLTLQQAEVLWSGDWETQLNGLRWLGPRSEDLVERRQTLSPEAREEELLFQERLNNRVTVNPELVILSMPVQDALVLKWAYEQPGVEAALVLRAQGDNALYFTTSVSLPQLVQQAGLSIPEPGQFGVNPAIEPASVPRWEFVPVEGTAVQGDASQSTSASGE
jgi:Flp pilus assembly protein CpaB